LGLPSKLRFVGYSIPNLFCKRAIKKQVVMVFFPRAKTAARMGLDAKKNQSILSR
jgi:hypothetical protein